MADTTMEVDQPAAASPTEGSSAQAGGNEARTSSGAVAVRSIEGWIVMVTNVHEEAGEEDLQELFGDYGDIKNFNMNLDRRSGYVKGYALVEFATKQEALAAIKGTNGKKLLDQTLTVDFAFVRPEDKGSSKNRGEDRRRDSKKASDRARSRSPEAE